MIRFPSMNRSEVYPAWRIDQACVLSAMFLGHIPGGCFAEAFWAPYRPLVDALIDGDIGACCASYSAENLQLGINTTLECGLALNPLCTIGGEVTRGVHTAFYWDRVCSRYYSLVERKSKLIGVANRIHDLYDVDTALEDLKDGSDDEGSQEVARKAFLLGVAHADHVMWDRIGDVQWGSLSLLADAIRFDEWTEEAVSRCQHIFGCGRTLGEPFTETLVRATE